MVQVQVRLPEKDVKTVDNWVEEGRFKSRSDAIKTILHYYEEREETRKFWRMLRKRSEEAELFEKAWEKNKHDFNRFQR